MKKIIALLLSCMLIAWTAAGAWAVVYGAEGYESHGDSEADAWEIDSVETLLRMRDDINDMINRYGKYYKLTTDLDLTDYPDWKPIGTWGFGSTFDGNGHTIKIAIEKSDSIYNGVFGRVSGTIKNLSVSGNIIVSWTRETASIYSDQVYAGGIAASLANGKIDNCKFDGIITMAINTVDRHDDSYCVGGIAGYVGSSVGSSAEISNCSVGSSNTSTSLEAETGYDSYAGGIAGYVECGEDTDPDRYGDIKITNNYSRCRTFASHIETLTYGYICNMSDISLRGHVILTDNTEVNLEAEPAPAVTAPIITTSSLPSVTLGTAYSATLEATGTSTITWNATGLPSGLTIDTSTGTISGTPTESGTFTVTITATNLGGSDRKAFTLTVNEPAPVATAPTITTAANLGTFTVGDSVSLQLTATGTTPITWTLTGGILPSGVTLSNTGLISGTVTTAGTFSFTVKASNSAGSDTRTFTLTVTEPVIAPTITTAESLGTFTVGDPISVQLASTGTNPITWTLSGGTLPSGVTLGNTGLISGTASKAGDFTFTVKASNSAGNDTRTFTLTVSEPAPVATPPAINTTSLPPATVGRDYRAELEASGSTPITWTYTGSMIKGLTLSEAGVISGIPSEVGTHTLTVKATNSAGSDMRALTLTVRGEAVSVPVIKTKKLPEGFIDVDYSFTLEADGEVDEWRLEGDVPSGLDIDAATGEISGTISTNKAKTFKLKVTAHNDAGDSKVQPLSLKVNSKTPSFKTEALKSATWHKKYSATIKLASLKATLWEIIGDLPDGLTFDTAKGKISGTPQEVGEFEFTVKATNGAVEIEQDYELAVKGIPPKLKGSLKKGTAGEHYSSVLKATGTTPIEWDFENLPDGLDFEQDATGETCTISGIPQKAFNDKVMVTLTNGSGDDSAVRKSLKMTVKYVKPKFKTKANEIPDGWVDERYEAQIVLSAGSPTIEWGYTGDMPDGLTLTDDGLISGTPKEAGKFTFSVTATNDAGKVFLKNITIAVARKDVPPEA